MKDLLSFLDKIIETRTTYQRGLKIAVKHTRDHGGTVEIQDSDEGDRFIILTLDGVEATVFKPYSCDSSNSDIDLFNYEA